MAKLHLIRGLTAMSVNAPVGGKIADLMEPGDVIVGVEYEPGDPYRWAAEKCGFFDLVPWDNKFPKEKRE